MCLMEKITRYVGGCLAWLVLVMTVLMAGSVAMRYGLNTSLIWQQELILYFHAAVFLLCSGWALTEDRHVRVDVLLERASAATKRRIDRLGIIFLLLPAMGFLLYVSFGFALSSWEMLEGSREYDGLPFVYVLKTMLPLGALLVMLAGLAVLAHNGDRGVTSE